MVLSEFLTRPLSQQEQQRLLIKLYSLLENQVKSYHKSRHMGQNSSVPTELAQELMASVEYTLGLAGGAQPNADLEKMLQTGQKILEEKLEKARNTLHLVRTTAPDWQTQCRWEAIAYLDRYLQTYDHRHLAHRSPEGLFYPICVPVPERLQGLDQAQFYLNVLWEENQIMAAFADSALESLWARLPVDCLNQCEQIICNVVGKKMLRDDLRELTFTQCQWSALEGLPLEEFSQRWDVAAGEALLGEYGRLGVQQMHARAMLARENQNLRSFFL